MKTDKSMNARGVFSAKLNIHDQTIQYRLKAFMRDFLIHLLSRDENDKFHKQAI